MEIDYPDLSDYNEKCNDIYVHDKKEEEVKIICKKFLRCLEKSTVWIVKEPGYDVFLLLNYWINDKLTHIFGDKNKTDVAFANFQRLWNSAMGYQRSISSDKKCKEKFHILDKEDWKKGKELYDYYIDYDTIKSAINFYGQCQEYYNYIEGKKELFEYFKDICSPESTECPDIYTKCKDYNPDKVLPTLSCHVQMVVANNDLGTQEDSEQGQVDGPYPHDSDLSGHRAASSEAGMTEENTDIGIKVGKSVLGIAPIALTASALYKFTPMGLWIRKLTGSNQNITGNMDGEDGFLDHTQDSSNILFNGAENYISYQPI
ncbi:PIR protein [Plasmodium ovale]|uniref:PIR protein n=1 Tax=Plasmodium ovale TaxID=36330 RepID=A0A1D3JFJ8_PLAOA|nr:PIR protein [Plasmodium ovale]